MMEVQDWSSGRRFLAALSMALVGLPLCSACAVAEGNKPNIVFILADDLGYGDLSSYGAPDLETPNIDRIGYEGVRFTNFYASSSVCSPTRAALLTGRHPELVGVPGVTRPHLPQRDWGYLSPDATLLPEHLSAEGYDTALTGKWHLGLDGPNTPNRRGFDIFQGWLSGMMDYYTHRQFGHNFMRDGKAQIDPSGHTTDLITDWAVSYINSREDGSDPYFLYVAYTAPHNPMQPRPDYVERARARVASMREDTPSSASPSWPLVVHEGMTEEDRLKLIGLVEHMDDGVGEILDALEATGDLENTVVMFASDNGGLLRDGGWNGPVYRAGKGSMYEGGLVVPFLARLPNSIYTNRTDDGVWSMIDVAPTLLRLAGMDVPQDMDGVDFSNSLLSGSGSAPERDLFFVRRDGQVQNYRIAGERFVMYGGAMRAVRRGPWKLLRPSPFDDAELYNLEIDPGELNNVIADHPDIARDLFLALQNHIGQGGQTPWRRPEIYEDEFRDPKNFLSAEEQIEGWRLLFDGQSLSGWQSVAGPHSADHWSVQDSELTALVGESVELISDASLEDFDLSFDWRVSSDGLASVGLVRGDPIASETDRETHEMNEVVRLTHGDCAASAAHQFDMPVCLESLEQDPSIDEFEYNTSLISYRNGELQVWLNGVRTDHVEAATARCTSTPGEGQPDQSCGTPLPGHIAFQNHHGRVWLSNIAIRRR